jgi:hypothetical protein
LDYVVDLSSSWSMSIRIPKTETGHHEN